MIYYGYNESTREFSFIREAQVDPVNTLKEGKTVYLGHGRLETDVAPPDLKEGYARCFIDGNWQYVEDHRGTVVYDTTYAGAMTIVALGAIPEGYTTLVPCEYPVWDSVNMQWTTNTTLKTTAENEALIQEEMARLIREQAIANLQASGTLK